MENQRDLLLENSNWFEINQEYQEIINNYLLEGNIEDAIDLLVDKSISFSDSLLNNKELRSRDLDILSVVASFLEEVKDEMLSSYRAKINNKYEDMENYLNDDLEFKIGTVIHVLSVSEALYQVAERREEGLLVYISEKWVNERGCNS